MGRERRKPKSSPYKRRKRKPCWFCVEKKTLDYKNVSQLRKYITDRGKIAPRRMTGSCALHQRMVAKVIKKARQLGLLPYVVE